MTVARFLFLIIFAFSFSIFSRMSMAYDDPSGEEETSEDVEKMSCEDQNGASQEDCEKENDKKEKKKKKKKERPKCVPSGSRLSRC